MQLYDQSFEFQAIVENISRDSDNMLILTTFHGR